MPVVTEFRSMTDTPGAGAYQRVLGFEGATQASATTGLFKVTPLGTIPRKYLSSGSTTMTQTLSRGGILTSTSAGATSILIPTAAAMGFIRDSTNPVEMAFLCQNFGTGGLFINKNVYLGAVATQAAMLALTANVGDFCQRTDLSNAMYELTALPAATLGNWVLRNGVNAPTTAGIVVLFNDRDTQYLTAGHPPVMLTTYGYDQWYAS